MTCLKSRIAFLLVIQAIVIAGCASSEQEELSQWMADARQEAENKRSSPYTVQAPTQFVAAGYQPNGDPFSSDRLALALRKDRGQNEGERLREQEDMRAKEPLEGYPLDSMAMVGSMLKNNKAVGLIKVDNLLYQVVVGNHLGQNFGRVTKIEEGQITLREVVQDSAGEWTEKTTVMQLQEN